tara:strand:- start:304 stop:1068 length:765 start_codon:yes stop_codon:yes gene_type:complete
MGQAIQFQRFFSVDSPKAIKASKFGYLNAINYMAPYKSAGRGNLCANASPGCIALCLGWYSGQASFVADLERDINNVRRSRIRKTESFFNDPQRFMHEAIYHIIKLERRARKLGLKLCVRLNGSQDIPFERIKIAAHDNRNIFELFPHVQFVDYTKILSRVLSTDKPKNLHLTFSRSEINESECKRALNAGVNVAVVFADGLPLTYMRRPVIDGDQHDLRHLDKQGKRGFIVGLSPKGRKAKRDESGFVVRGAA